MKPKPLTLKIKSKSTKKNNLDYVIKPVDISDASFIHKIRSSPEVARNILCLPSEREENTKCYIENLDINDHVYVASLKSGEVIGMVSLRIKDTLRQRHTGSIAIFVSNNFQNKKIGTSLLNKILDVSDNWLLLHRLELTVFEDNLRAIHLYEKNGFKKEGLKIHSTIRDGIYVNEWIMSRILKSKV